MLPLGCGGSGDTEEWGHARDGREGCRCRGALPQGRWPPLPSPDPAHRPQADGWSVQAPAPARASGLAFEKSLSFWFQVLKYMDYIFTGVFTFEMVIKVRCVVALVTTGLCSSPS